MDERHWWIAQRISQTFGIDSNSRFLEKLITEPNNLEKVNNFLCMNGSNKLFFYNNRDEIGKHSTINIIDNLLKLPRNNQHSIDNVIILYMIRHDTIQEVSLNPAQISKEIYCGEIKNVSQILYNVYNDLLFTIFESNKNWGNCSEQSKSQSIRNMGKYINAINEFSVDNQNLKNMMLKRVDPDALTELKQPRINPDAPIIKYCEDLAYEWMQTIENILSDICDERFIHQSVGPASELERWIRKQRLLSNLTEQLKTKECKSVISALIAAKSKVLKKWKVIDTGITDAQNECRDKVKFLESLRRPIDQFYDNATPITCINTALPGLCTAMRTVESVSRYYARHGYLGLLFTKVTNQLVNICKEYLLEMVVTKDGENYFWPSIFKEIEDFSSTPNFVMANIIDNQESMLNASMSKSAKLTDSIESTASSLANDTLFNRLKSCLIVQMKYKDAFRALRDALGGNQALSSFPSVSSFQVNSDNTSNLKDSLNTSSNKKSINSNLSQKANGEIRSHGILMSEEDIIFGHIDTFCNRIRCIIDQITSLAQFQLLLKASTGLSRPKKEDLEIKGFQETGFAVDFDDNAGDEDIKKEDDDEGIDVDADTSKNTSTKALIKSSNLGEPISEDEHNSSNLVENSTENLSDRPISPNKDLIKSVQKLNSIEENIDKDSKAFLEKTQFVSKEDIKLMRKYYGKSDQGPTISAIIEGYIKNMRKYVTSVTASQVLDVETKNSYLFEESYKMYLEAVNDLDVLLAAYLNVIFVKPKKTHDSLNILTRFKSVSQRNLLRPILNDKYVEVFTSYEKDLEEAEKTFENYKNNPPLPRNSPPIGGAISWVRQLLKKIDEPIKIFKENKYISNLGDFNLIVKQHNKLTNAIYYFENNHLNNWKNSIEEGKNGLKGFLLRKSQKDFHFEINSDIKLVLLFQEIKWLSRMGIEIPNSAKELVSQEKKFKQFKSNLETLTNKYQKVKNSIPSHLFPLHEPHINQILDLCNQGCFILTWTSLNIDSFLKMVENGITKLDQLVKTIKYSKEKRIYDIIDDIDNMILFDYNLMFSKRWKPHEFTFEIENSIENKKQLLHDKFSQIETQLEEIGYLLINLPKETTSRKKSKLTLKDLLEIEPKLNDLKKFYSEKLYKALNTSILNSINCLVSSCGYQSALDELYIHDNAYNDSTATLKSPDDFIKYIRVKSTEDITKNQSSKERPISVSSALADLTWNDEVKLENAFLNLEFDLKYVIPDVLTEPSLDNCQKIIKNTANKIKEIAKIFTWINTTENKTYYDCIIQDSFIQKSYNFFDLLISDIGPTFKNFMIHFKLFEFLWKEDLNTLFSEFIKHKPTEYEIKREVERLVKIEKKVIEIPDFLNIGPVCLNTESIKTSLKMFSYNWKCKYASLLHEIAKTRLEESIIYRENVQKRLSVNVQTLEQLNDALRLLEELSDMENKIDKIYLPIENIYSDLRRYELILTRQEIDQVTNLRDNWSKLMENAEKVRRTLLQDKRNTLEQELDKQVKTFVVEVIRFRNSFDATGPSVTGIDPYEALRRLNEFQKNYDTYDARRKTLDSISMLFGLQCKPFPELDKTGEELALLNQLYKVYEVFLHFDKVFRNTLWSEVDLNRAFTSVKQFWSDFLALPEKLKENWQAYYDLEKALKKYLDVLPVLLLLNEKEVRNRHWIQVMQVTKSAFRLEAAVFKINDLIDIGLDSHAIEIEEICKSAKKELELETKMRQIDEEWNEQVLVFKNYKDYGEVIFDKEYTERLLEQLEDAQEILANMLTSKYVTPLRNEVASWSEKLRTIGDVLELWLEVQDLWITIEFVFTNPVTVKEMPAEAKRFQRVDKSWIRSQKQSFDMKSVLQCCLGSSVQENTKRVLLKDIQKELEICFKSLNSYLDKKRRSFPRYYFLSNSNLLILLSHSNNTNNLSTVKPFYSSLFSAVYDLRLDDAKDEQDFVGSKSHITSANILTSDRKKNLYVSEMSLLNRSSTKENSFIGNMEIADVLSADGEIFTLFKKVSLEKGPEAWIPRLKESISESLKKFISNSFTDLANNALIEELPMKYPAQVCLICLAYSWTKEVETSILEFKNERKAVSFGSKKFTQTNAKLLIQLSKSSWTSVEKPVLGYQKLRLESMVTFSSYLRDSFDALANRKIKDLTDFEWLKCFRVYLHDESANPLTPKFYVLDDSYNYGSEFYGCDQIAVITPLTERCFLSIWQASRIFKGALLAGKSNVGKTQIAKGLAQYLGKYMSILYCSSHTDPISIANCLQGIAQEGSWGLFDEVQSLNDLCVSWLNEYSNGIFQALRKRINQVVLGDGKEISINQNFGIMLTMNSFKEDSHYIPHQFRSMFRVLAVIEPDVEMVIRARCIQYGVKAPNILSIRLKTLHDLCQSSLISIKSKYQITVDSFLSVIRSLYEKQRSEATTDSRPTSYATKELSANANKINPAKIELLTNQSVALKDLARKNRLALVNFSKNEHATIGQAIVEIISPRLEPDDAKQFKKFVYDVLMIKEDTKASQALQSSKNAALEKIISEKAASDYNLFPNKSWIEKCLQIYSVSNIYKGIILCGPPCTGKTSTLKVLVDSLSELTRTTPDQSKQVFKLQKNIKNAHKIRHINPLATDDLSLVFGTIVQHGEFKDGLLSYMLKKACRNQSTTWLCLDGPILPNWCDNFNSIFDSGLFLQLKNGDHLNNMCKLVFETCDISNASPSIVSKAGIICYGDELVGWRSIARSWLDSRTRNEIHCLQKCFSKTMDEVCNYVFKECKPIMPVREESLFISLLSLLAAMLNESIGGEIHIERLFLYCLIWTFGGVLEQNDQKGFSDLLYRQISTLPDDDLKSSVFEYYVDESGEWDLWTQRVPENIYMDNMDLLGNVYVDTIDTIRCRIFLEFCNVAHKNVILFGPRGCGKSKLVQEFVHDLDANLNVVKRLNFSSATNVTQIQKFIEANIVHRQGFTYGAQNNKSFSIFVDDLNAPAHDEYGLQRCNEFIRQLIDSKYIYSYSKPFEVKQLEGVSFFSTMTYYPGIEKTIDPRLLRHSVLLHLPSPSGDALKSIFNGTLEGCMLHNDKASLDVDLHSSIIDASMSLLNSINDVLKPCPTPGRQHYLFNMKHIISILQGLRVLSDTQRSDPIIIISLWKHEAFCTIGNQLPRHSDFYWLESTIQNIVKEKFASYNPTKLIESFYNFKLEARNYDRPLSGIKIRQVKATLNPIESIDQITKYLEQVYNRYKEEFGYHQINLFLSENATIHIIRIYRILTFIQNGNLLLIGNIGNHLTSLCKLALYLAEIQLNFIDCSKPSLFYDSMRAAVQSAGSENRNIGIIFSSKDLIRDEYINTINSLLINGECADLFSNDEMDGLFNAISSSIKREHPNMVLDPKKYFNTRIKRNLHICITLAPTSEIFQLIIKSYPNILSNCQIYWIRDWTEETLLSEARFFMKNRLDSDDLREKIARCMSEIHLHMLNESSQIFYAGEIERDIKYQQTKIIEKKKEQVQKTISVSMPNWPYSKNVLQELNKLKHTKTDEKSKNHFFIGSNKFITFMNSFWYFFTTKAKQCEQDIIRLNRVLETLSKTREGARQMRAYIKDLKIRCKQAEQDSEDSLKALIEKTTAVERLKAQLGMGGSLAALMQMQEDTEITTKNLFEDSKLLHDGGDDDYDKEFNRMREESYKNKQAKMAEEYEKAKQIVEESKKIIVDKRKQVEYWRNKVDRPCIEKIRAFQNPPVLIGQIMEMVLIMIGKKKFPEIFKSSESTPQSAAKERDETAAILTDKQPATSKQTKSKVTGKLDRLDKNQWKIYQNMMQDSNKFVDLLHNIEWEEGLPSDIIQNVEGYLVKGKDEQLGITGEGSLIENAKEINIPAGKTVETTNSKGITISGARYASEDAAVLVHYCIAIAEYSKLCLPLKAAREKLESIKQEKINYEKAKQDREAETAETVVKHQENYSEIDLPRLMQELQDLQVKFDAAAVKKHKLHKELDSCIQRVEAATTIIERLTNLEDQWKKWIEEHLSHEQTISNCLITAAYICYCGPFDNDIRMRFRNFFSACCVKYEIPKEPQQIFKEFTLSQFLFTDIQLRELELLRLPSTEHILENGCFLIEDKSCDNWPLICDPSRRSIDWLRDYHKDKQFFILRQYEMKSVLETCLSEGHYLLLTDCDVNLIMSNKRIEKVLRNKSRFINSDRPFKLNLGNQEIECNPKFRLFLHTISDSIRLPPYLAAYTTVVNFSLTRTDMEEELLDRFLLLAKPRIDNERYGLLQEKVNTLKIIDPLEQDITNFLASDVNLLKQVEPTKKLSDLKKAYDEAVDSNLRIENAEEPLNKTRESYRDIALRAAICYDVISSLRELNPNYILSYKQFTQIFDDSLYQFERSSTPQVINKLTTKVFNCISQMMSESDRKIFSILLCFEIEAAAGRMRSGEKEFIISPLFGAMVIQTLTNKNMTEHKHWTAKKPFDWMSDEQFVNLQYLAVSHSWFSDPFDRMARDGRETQWRSLCESEIPENMSLPDKLDEVLNPIQRFCIIRAVRGDRILQQALSFVSTVLGKSFIASNQLDFESVLAESSAQKPIILMYKEESETVRRLFVNFAKTKIGNYYSIIDIYSLGLNEDKQIKRLMSKSIEEGTWLLIRNFHNSPNILNQIEAIINESANHKLLNPNFRCWISLQETQKPPSSLMLNSIRVFISQPQTMKENIMRSFSWIDSDQAKLSNKPEWPILLHNIIYFHSCLRLRSRYYRCGWNSPSSLNFTTEEFLESLRVAIQEYSFSDSTSRTESVKSLSDVNKNISVQAIKFIISDLIYGISASNEYDFQAIQSIADHWLASVAVRKDFELSKLKYKIPNSFYNQPVKLNSLLQSLENISPMQLDAPEACHLLPSIETVLGDDVYIITRLNKLIDTMPSSTTNLKVYERPLTPFDNSVVPQINSNSTNSLVYQANSFSSSSYMATLSKKYADLNEYCTTILNSKLPKPLTKDQINEKIKKNGGWNLYNTWIAREMNLITNLINSVKNHLQLLKNETESKKLGLNWNDELIEVADSLYHNQVPKLWCIMSGNNTNVLLYSLAQFFTDLTTRFQHIDKCLTLGREKTPAYNLGAFYFPQGLLSLFKYETLKNKNSNDEIGCLEALVFQTEMTSRDKEHLRDPPKEGMFIYGLYLWGCHWEKSTSELIDQSIKTKEGYMSLPVIHLTCWLESEKPLLQDAAKQQDLYKCPVYPNRKDKDQSVLEIDLIHSGITAQKWAMRGVCATLKPF